MGLQIKYHPMDRVILKVGGSILAPETQDIAYIEKLSKLLLSLKKQGYRLIVVVGGGGLTRKFIELARKVGANNYLCDEIAIQMTRLNARFLIAALGEENASPVVPTHPDDAISMFSSNKIICMGGTIPGHTTDAVSVLLAEALNARWVKACGVDGIYEEDPKKNHNAKKFDKISHEKVVEMASAYDSRRAGSNFVIDVLAAKILQRGDIEGCIVNGKDFENLRNAIIGKKHKGTEIEG